MNRKRAHEFDFGPRWSSGYREYRYGEMHSGSQVYGLKSRITLVGPRPKSIFRGEKRKHVVAEAMNVMRDWRLSPFEHEGSTRAGMRSCLCLDGHDWYRADDAAADIVKECLHRLGAERPSYLKGQREYTIPREFCRCCMGPLDDEALASSQSFCCEECAISVRTRDTDLYERLMMNSRNRASRIKANADAAPRRCSHAECGRPYKSADPDQTFCSKECANKSRRTLSVRNCLWCQKSFQPRGDSKHCCSRDCATKHGARTRAQTLPEVSCPICMSVFRKRTPGGIYCSPACKTMADNRSRRQPVRYAECAVCSRSFQQKRSDAIYCGGSCATFANEFKAKRYPKTLTLRAFDYMLKCEGLRLTEEVRIAA